jgi:hypothetical protein
MTTALSNVCFSFLDCKIFLQLSIRGFKGDLEGDLEGDLRGIC